MALRETTGWVLTHRFSHGALVVTELQALQRYADVRDPQAFRVLVETYQSLVYGVCRRRLSCVQDAEDATQETFLKLAKAAGEIRTSLAAWLHACATHTAIDVARRESRRKKRETAVSIDPASVTVDPDWEIVRQELDDAILQLPEDERQLLVEHYLMGRSQADLAEEFEVNQATVSRRLTRVVECLRGSLRADAAALGVTTLTAGLAAEGAAAAVPTALGGELMKIALVGAGTKTSAMAAAGTGLAVKTKLLLASGIVAAATLGTTAVVMQSNGGNQSPAPNASPASASSAVAAKTNRDPMKVHTDLLSRYAQAGKVAEGQTILRNTIPLTYKGTVVGGRIEGDRIKVHQIDDQSGLFKAELRIAHSAPNASPKQLDLYPVSMNNKRIEQQLKQWLSGRPLQCIYETQSFGDVSALILMGQADQRPTSFETIEGPRWGMGLIKSGAFAETTAVNEKGIEQAIVGSYLQTQLTHNDVPLEIDSLEDEMVYAFPQAGPPGDNFEQLPSSSGVNLYRITHCDPTANPKQIDIRIIDHNNGGWEPSEMGQTMKGIYVIDGEKLLTVFAYPGFNRPLSVDERRDVIRDSAILVPGTKRHAADQDGQVDAWGVDKALRARWAYVAFAW